MPKKDKITKCPKCGKAVVNGKHPPNPYKEIDPRANLALAKDTQERELANKIINFIIGIRPKEADLLNDERISRSLGRARVQWDDES